MIKKFSFLIGILLFGFQFGQQSKEQLQKQNADLKKQIAQIIQNWQRPEMNQNYLYHI